MSGKLVTLKRQVPTIPQALKALAAMRQQLTAERTYAALQRIIRQAEALRVLMRDVAEVKQEAEKTVLLAHRRIGQELDGIKKLGGPGRGKRISARGKSFSEKEATGIKATSRHRLGKLLDLSPGELEATADRLHASGKDATVHAVVQELTQGSKQERRNKRERELAGKVLALPDRKFSVIAADPEWQWEPWSHKTGMDRAAANHYPTSCLAVIKARDVPSITAKDCVLLLWATIPMLPHALTVMAAWGFDYKSHYAWGKDKIGTGYWSREKHELLLIGTRGDIPCPAPGKQWESLVLAPRGKHSEKPEVFLEMIEEYFPNLPKIELNRRGPPRTGWAAWGDEASEAAE